MSLSWNLVGIAAWIILIIWFVFTIHDIRRRHLKMIVVEKKKFSILGTTIDFVEVLILIVGFGFMNSTTFLNHANINDNSKVSITYKYEPLVIQTNGDIGFYVKKETNEKTSTDEYTYWEKSAKYKVSSKNAFIVSETKNLKNTIDNYPWNKEALIKADKENQGAFVAKITSRYKNTFINGLGMHAGKKADEFRIIKVPAENFVIEK
ncbi:LVIS_2131 family protein [Companilactobacillus sp. DQM5]|uniref:LVIS_2131 family protein n=1 Tax=Companilactobacillus sp. DQM5 TaxID=3463359 RepID=UPI004058FD07